MNREIPQDIGAGIRLTGKLVLVGQRALLQDRENPIARQIIPRGLREFAFKFAHGRSRSYTQ